MVSRREIVRALSILLYICGVIGHLEYSFNEDEVLSEVVTVYDSGGEEVISIHENWEDYYDLIVDVVEEVRRINMMKSIKTR